MSSGMAARAAEQRKHSGAEAIHVFFSIVASHLAVSTNARALATLYGRLSSILVRANAGAILMRSLPSFAFDDIILDL